MVPESLPVLNTECPICLETLEGHNVTLFTSHAACKHAGHASCVAKMCSTMDKPQCPLCRHAMLSKTLRFGIHHSYECFEFAFLGFCFQEQSNIYGKDPSAEQEAKFLTRWIGVLPEDQRDMRYDAWNDHFQKDPNEAPCSPERVVNWAVLVALLLRPTQHSTKIFTPAFVSRIASEMWSV